MSAPVVEPPCPCFLFEDNGQDEEQCECGSEESPHSREDHPKGQACLVGHLPDCPLDHGDSPCPEPLAQFQDRLAEAMVAAGAQEVRLP